MPSPTENARTTREGDAADDTTWLGSAARVQAVVGLVALTAYAWVLALAFQLDDYDHIRTSMAMFGALPDGADLPRADGPASAEADPSYIFRPVLWTALALAWGITSTPVAPFGFHLLLLGVHVGNTLLLHALFRRLLHPMPALVGALFFAIHPGAAQAVSWVSAGGDPIALLCLLVGAHAVAAAGRATDRPLWRYTLAAGISVGVATAAKESALTAVAFFGVWLLCLRRPSTALGVLAFGGALVGPLLVTLSIRRAVLGTWSLQYAGGSTAKLSLLGESLARLGEYLPGVLYPWNQAPEVDSFAPFVPGLLIGQTAEATSGVLVWFALPFAAPLLIAVVLTPFFSLPRLGLVAIAFLCAAVPALFHHVPTPESEPHLNHASRTACMLMPSFAFVVGLAVEAARRWRDTYVLQAALLAVGAVGILSIDTLVHVARTELAVAARIEQRLAVIDAAVDTDDGDSAIVVIDPEAQRAGISMLGVHAPSAFRPPFHAREVELYHLTSRAALTESGLLRSIARRIRVLELDDDGYLTDTRAPIPPLQQADGPAELHEERTDNPGSLRLWRPRAEVAPRALAGFAFPFAAGAAARVAVVFDGGTTRFERVLAMPASDAARELTVLVDDTDDWSNWNWSPGIEAIELRSDPATLDLAETPRLLTEDVPLEIVLPDGAETFDLGDLPTWTVTGVPPSAAGLRFRFDVVRPGVRAPMIFEIPNERLEAAGNRRSWTWNQQSDRGTGEYAWLDFGVLSELWDTMVAPHGIERLEVPLRVEALHADGVTVMARSPWRPTYATKK